MGSPSGHVEQQGHGLAIVAALSACWQIDGDGQSGRIVWFEIAGK
jgi:hypothetical protein